MKIKANLKLILSESYRWRNRELLEQRGFVEPKLTLRTVIKKNFLIFLFSAAMSLLLYPFINDQFAGYIISSLSIFVGLFTSVLILIFDKYINQKKVFDDSGVRDAASKLQQKKIRNFSKQFVYISLESLIIAVALIALLLLPLLFKNIYLQNIFNYHFIEDISSPTYSDFKFLIINTIAYISRTLIILLLIKFIKYLFYIFGSLGSFLMGVFKNHIRL